jgi:hypothetical protein
VIDDAEKAQEKTAPAMERFTAKKINCLEAVP